MRWIGFWHPISRVLGSCPAVWYCVLGTARHRLGCAQPRFASPSVTLIMRSPSRCIMRSVNKHSNRKMVVLAGNLDRGSRGTGLPLQPRVGSSYAYWDLVVSVSRNGLASLVLRPVASVPTEEADFREDSSNMVVYVGTLFVPSVSTSGRCYCWSDLVTEAAGQVSYTLIGPANSQL